MLSNITTRFLTKQVLKCSYPKRNVNTSAFLFNNATDTSQEPSTKQQEPQQAQSQPNPNLEAEFKALTEKNKKSESDLADFKDRYMRALAEAENTRVRMRKQVDEAKIFGIQGFCKDLLEVADTIHLAVVNTDVNKMNTTSENKTPDEQLKLAKTQVKAIYDGLVLTESKLIKIFEKHGLNRIVPKEGDKFDPNIHEAIFQAKIPNKESGSICTVNQIGYKLQERVIRAAQVGVAQ